MFTKVRRLVLIGTGFRIYSHTRGIKCRTESIMIALMTTEDVAEFAKVTTKTVYQWIKKGANGTMSTACKG